MKQKATLALFVVTIIWGWTFVWLKQALDTAELYSSGNLGATTVDTNISDFTISLSINL